jgi:hypothetical protein
MPLTQPGSIWIQCNAKGEAACPHCGKVGWYRGDKWAGCEHAVGPGHMGNSIDTPPALIFKGQPKEASCQN